ncbi:MAG: hypothetical protein SVR08_10010 [Spirochaetota bacterium]|nr:hypothetical protein [Spirochaetota bacterium]
MIHDRNFSIELVKRVHELQKAGIKEKNIVKNEIKRVKRIRIGDKEFSPTDSFNRKNIVEGSIEDANEFVIGDGH